MRAHLSDGHLYSGDKVRKLQAKHYFLIDTGAGEKVFLNLYDAECYCMDHQLNPDEVIKSGDPETWLRAVKLAQVKAITLLTGKDFYLFVDNPRGNCKSSKGFVRCTGSLVCDCNLWK